MSSRWVGEGGRLPAVPRQPLAPSIEGGEERWTGASSACFRDPQLRGALGRELTVALADVAVDLLACPGIPPGAVAVTAVLELQDGGGGDIQHHLNFR